MNLSNLKLFGLAILFAGSLSACTPTQEANALTTTSTLCTLGELAEVGDPALAQHNPEAVKVAAFACSTTPSVIAVLPVKTTVSATVANVPTTPTSVAVPKVSAQ